MMPLGRVLGGGCDGDLVRSGCFGSKGRSVCSRAHLAMNSCGFSGSCISCWNIFNLGLAGRIIFFSLVVFFFPSFFQISFSRGAVFMAAEQMCVYWQPLKFFPVFFQTFDSRLSFCMTVGLSIVQCKGCQFNGLAKGGTLCNICGGRHSAL